MIPYYLRLEGFTGIRDGLNRAVIELNLEALCGDAALVAVAGANGRGKTTILDNLTPYLIMPSQLKPGQTSFSYYAHVYLPVARKVLEWGALDGQRYRSEIIVRCGRRHRTEAYLTRSEGGQWRPVRCADGTVSDGHQASYQQCVEAIVGSQNLYFAATFAAQNRRLLHEFEQPEAKALLLDLLDQQRLRPAGAQAAEVVRLLKPGLLALRQQLRGIEADADEASRDADALRQRLDTSTDAQARRDALQARLRERQRQLAELRNRQQAQLQLQQRHDELLAQRRAVVLAARQAVAELERQDQREAAQARALDARQLARRRHAEGQRTLLRQRIAALDHLLQQRDAVSRARRRAGLAARLAQRRLERAQTVRARCAELNNQQHALLLLQQELAGLEREAGRAALDANALTDRLALTRAVPCQGMPLQAGCQLLGEAHQARALLPSAHVAIGRLNAQRRAVQARLQQAQGALAGLATAEQEAARADYLLLRSQQRVEQLNSLAAQAEALQQAMAGRAEAAAQLEQGRLDAEQAEQAEAAEDAAIARARARIARLRDAGAARHRRQLAPLDAALERCTPDVAPDQIAQAARAVDQVAEQLALAERELGRLAGERALLAQQNDRLARLQARGAAMTAHIACVEAQLATWNLLAKCLGNDGVIALLIDDAGPALATLANQLLLACYGGRFTLAIATQVPAAEGWKEGFAIMVHDGESGASKPVERTSFGERLWINECLTRAMALYLARQHAPRHGTLFSDETDGALDPARKRMFLAMKRTVLRLGGYRREFFITHTPELAAMADVVIDLETYRLAGPAPQPEPEVAPAPRPRCVSPAPAPDGA